MEMSTLTLAWYMKWRDDDDDLYLCEPKINKDCNGWPNVVPSSDMYCNV